METINYTTTWTGSVFADGSISTIWRSFDVYELPF